MPTTFLNCGHLSSTPRLSHSSYQVPCCNEHCIPVLLELVSLTVLSLRLDLVCREMFGVPQLLCLVSIAQRSVLNAPTCQASSSVGPRIAVAKLAQQTNASGSLRTQNLSR